MLYYVIDALQGKANYLLKKPTPNTILLITSQIQKNPNSIKHNAVWLRFQFQSKCTVVLNLFIDFLTFNVKRWFHLHLNAWKQIFISQFLCKLKRYNTDCVKKVMIKLQITLACIIKTYSNSFLCFLSVASNVDTRVCSAPSIKLVLHRETKYALPSVCGI